MEKPIKMWYFSKLIYSSLNALLLGDSNLQYPPCACIPLNLSHINYLTKVYWLFTVLSTKYETLDCVLKVEWVLFKGVWRYAKVLSTSLLQGLFTTNESFQMRYLTYEVFLQMASRLPEVKEWDFRIYLTKNDFFGSFNFDFGSFDVHRVKAERWYRYRTSFKIFH